jgi:predicted Zn finger-like uncharacterized protein
MKCLIWQNSPKLLPNWHVAATQVQFLQSTAKEQNVSDSLQAKVQRLTQFTPEVSMSCPKCKAKVGITKHEIMLDTGVVKCTRCIICGYWSQPPSAFKQKIKPRQQQAVM